MHVGKWCPFYTHNEGIWVKSWKGKRFWRYTGYEKSVPYSVVIGKVNRILGKVWELGKVREIKCNSPYAHALAVVFLSQFGYRRNNKASGNGIKNDEILNFNWRGHLSLKKVWLSDVYCDISWQ